MHLIFCIDERDGLSFCGRRLSQDRELVSHMLNLTSGSQLWIHPYSSKLFPEGTVLADEDYLSKANAGDYCWIEKGPFPKVWQSVESVTLYHWNRAYPSTERFPRSLLKNMYIETTEDFSGNSHENIIMERFVP
jgi:hypothetical protein